MRVFGCSDQWDGDKAFRAVPCLGTAARPGWGVRTFVVGERKTQRVRSLLPFVSKAARLAGFWRAIKIPPVTSVSTSLLTPWTPSTARCGREARMTEAWWQMVADVLPHGIKGDG